MSAHYTQLERAVIPCLLQLENYAVFVCMFKAERRQYLPFSSQA